MVWRQGRLHPPPEYQNYHIALEPPETRRSFPTPAFDVRQVGRRLAEQFRQSGGGQVDYPTIEGRLPLLDIQRDSYAFGFDAGRSFTDAFQLVPSFRQQELVSSTFRHKVHQ